MKCLNPIFKKITLTTHNNFKNVTLTNFRKFLSSPSSYITDDKVKYVEIPCGKCVFCLQNKVNEWSLRIKHELMFFRTGLFITLTYNNDFIPRTFLSKPKIVGDKLVFTDTNLVKKHLQDFFKRLRYYLDKQGRKIKYYACGEYGDYTDRAHYHAIILGMKSFSFSDRELIKKCWKYGFIHFGDASVASGRYVAKYCNKVHEDYNYKNRYILQNREPPFKLSSLCFGKRYVEKEKENLYNNLYIQNGPYKMSIPRTYYRWLKKYYSDIQDKIKEKVSKFRETQFYKLVSLYSSKLTPKGIESVFSTVKKIIKLNVVLKNNFLDEINVYDLSNFPRLYNLYYKSLLQKANDLKLKEKRKIDNKKLAIF